MAECYCDYEAFSVYRQAIHVARKQHKCYECGAAILPGDRYESAFGVYDGEPHTMATCPLCLDLRQFVLAHVPCSCWTHGDMIETIIGDAQQYAHEAPGLLFGAYRRQVRIKRRSQAGAGEGKET